MIKWLTIAQLEEARLAQAIAEQAHRAEWRPKAKTEALLIEAKMDEAKGAKVAVAVYKPPMAVCPKCLRNVLCIGGIIISHRISEGSSGPWCVNNQSL